MTSLKSHMGRDFSASASRQSGPAMVKLCDENLSEIHVCSTKHVNNVTCFFELQPLVIDLSGGCFVQIKQAVAVELQ